MKFASRISGVALGAMLFIDVAAAGTELGTLPPQQLAQSTAGPADELIGFLLFDPSRIQDRIPRGMRLRTLEEKSRDWPRLAAYLEAHPDRRGWAWSVYEVIGIHAARYDSLDARFDSGRGGMAVWYPEVTAIGEADPRALGEQILALGSWVSDPALVDYMRSRSFPATPARLTFEWNESRADGALEADGLTIRGHCRLEGPSFVPWWGKDPHSFQTMWTPAGEGDTFEVVTWAGHRSRKCRDADWRVSGTHPFAMLFNDPKAGDPAFLPTEFAYGYLLKSGLYPRQVTAAGNLYTRVAAKLAADPELDKRLGQPGPEMAAVSWLLGDWEVVSEVQAPGVSRTSSAA